MTRTVACVCAAVPLALHLASAFRLPNSVSLASEIQHSFYSRQSCSRTGHKTSAFHSLRMTSSMSTKTPYEHLHPPPAKPGDSLSQIDTPALCVGLDALEANCDSIAALMAPYAGKVAVRPHAKASKSGELASMVIRRIKKANPAVECTGVCCQKLTEAEAVLHYGGVTDILLTNQIVAPQKIQRLASLAADASKLAADASVAVLVDDASNVGAIAAAARSAGTKIKVLVEVDAGQRRCGLPAPLSPQTVACGPVPPSAPLTPASFSLPRGAGAARGILLPHSRRGLTHAGGGDGRPLVELVRSTKELDGVEFAGLHCYQGLLQHVRAPGDRQRKVQEQVVGAAEAAVKALSAAGLWEEGYTVTGGGTGTFSYECEGDDDDAMADGSAQGAGVGARMLGGLSPMRDAQSGLFTEVQPGSFIFMDGDYNANQWPGTSSSGPFRSSLHVAATVISRTGPAGGEGGRAVLDAGSKAVDYGSAPPLVVDSPYAAPDPEGLRCRNGGDEHSVIDLPAPGDALDAEGADRFGVGELVWLVPGHCDPTVNMHDWFVCHRGGKVEAVIPILCRGPGS